MEIDLANAQQDLEALSWSLRSPVCIIGGGIAGLTLAAHFEAQGIDCTLLEAGGSAHHPLADADPFGAELCGTPHAGTSKARVRAFGGTSHTWGGQLLPLPDDAGWPLSVLPSLSLGVETHPSDAEAFFAQTRQSAPALFASLSGMVARFSCFLPFTRRNLASLWGKRLRRSTRAKVVLHAAVREIVLAPAGDLVEAVLLRTGDGRELRVMADQFILAAGTVETCRLLLASRSVRPGGVGNDFGQVGERFHDHLTCSAAVLTGAARKMALEQLRPWIFASRNGEQMLYSPKLEAGSDLRKQLGIPPAMAHLTIEEPAGTGIAVVRQLLRARQAGGLRRALRSALRHLPGALVDAVRFVWEARFRHRRYVSPKARVMLQINLAQEPSEAMRIALGGGDGNDGMPPARVHWAVSEGDLRHMRSLAGHLRERLGAAGLRDGVAWLPALFEAGAEADATLRAQVDDARHAMGGACMGSDPSAGVVDPDLRVHGIPNLSIASAAVFPDGSAQLPTATLLALCERLADRLRRELA